MKSRAQHAEVDPRSHFETAGEIMSTDVISVRVGTTVRDVALLMHEKRISAVPVLAADQQLVGMVSEGDLLGRSDADRHERKDWWLALLMDGEPPTETFATLVSSPVEHVMHAPVVTVQAEVPLHEIAEMLRVYDLKRMPVTRDGLVVGIVSRSDLVRAVAAMTPEPVKGPSVGGLLSMITGMMKAETRPPAASTPTSGPRAPASDGSLVVTAGAFLALVTASKQTERDDKVAAKAQAKLDRQNQIKVMLQDHVNSQMWSSLLERAQAAASHGENSFELARFPCELCSDGGRKIDVAEADWPTTLRGEAAEMYTRWERDLRGVGFGLRARMEEYLDGMPIKVALSLTWSD